jgi:glutathione S-transferase
MSSYGVKPPAFRAISPSGAIPVARIDGRIISESNDIMFELDARFPQTPMMPPPGTPAAARARELMDLERALFSAWFGWLRSRQDGLGKFEFLLERVCAALTESGGPYFLGGDVSMVDLMFVPFVERMVASLPYYKGVRVRGDARWAALDRWLLALETGTDWYAGIKSDYYSHVHDLPPQIGGCVSTGADADRIAAQVDGTDGRSWALPLPAATLAALEPVSPPIADADARLEAAERLLRNHAYVARFAARAVGEPGSPGVAAPLFDPNAKPELLAVPAVDAALRHVVHALLVGPAESRAGGRSSLPAREVAMSLAYLRDRVGVPRDMSYAAARQLRAHLNDFSAELTGGKVMY